MHRSGTSAVAGTAVRLGVAPPRTMLPPAADNPFGSYEPTWVVELNEWLLRAAGCAWFDCLSFDLNRLDETSRQAASDMARDILRNEFPDAAAFMIKDPRLCLTLPLWLRACQAAGVAVTVLFAIRHPGEVVQSIARRDRLSPSALPPVWLHYVLEAERATRGVPRRVIFYDELLDDWTGCMARAARITGFDWPAGIGGNRADIDAFLDRSFRHHVAPPGAPVPGAPPIPGLIAMTWEALRKLREDQDSPDARESRYALEWLDQAHATFAGWRATAPRVQLLPKAV